jgi:pilus assembly protein CpaE
MGSVVIADPSETFRETLQSALAERDGVTVELVEGLEEARERAATGEPYVVLLGPSLDPEEAIRASSHAADAAPNTAFVLVALTPTAELLRAALRAGMRDVVPAEQPIDDVVLAVMDAYGHSDRQRAAAPAPAAAVEAPAKCAKIVTVFSTKGGVGKTVVATNLGVALAQRKDARVVLLDLDLQFGDTGIMLQLAPDRTIADAVQSFERLDPEMLEGFLADHPSGLRVLLAPVHPEDAENITVSRVAGIIDMLKTMVDFIVIDTPAEFSEVVLTAIDHSDEVYAIVTMDVAAIKNTRISLQKLRQLGYDDRIVRLVLNRADSKVWLSPGEVEKTVESSIVAKIPSDRLVPRSVNKGVPVVIDAPKSGVARSLVELAGTVAKRDGKAVPRVAQD